MRAEDRNPLNEHDYVVNWLDVAPTEESARRDYFVRLITILAYKVGKDAMREAVSRALDPPYQAPSEPKP